MDTLIQADIFFFISTIAVVLLCIGAAIVIVYLVRILRDIRYISKRLRDESDRIIVDVESLRSTIKNEGLKFIDIFHFVVRLFTPRGKKKKKYDNEQ